jgi:hypothetical protein
VGSCLTFTPHFGAAEATLELRTKADDRMCERGTLYHAGVAPSQGGAGFVLWPQDRRCSSADAGAR